MTPCPLVHLSVYCSGILLINLYLCAWTIYGANNDTVFRPMQPNELREFLTSLREKNDTQWFKCPAPKLPITDEECKVERCYNDDDCNNETCCFNGCVFTCVQQMAPPAVIDWFDESDFNSVFSSEKVDNVTASISGASYAANDMRPCSISPRPAPSEPVGCPSGYLCRVQSSGDSLDGAPTTGVCVPSVHAGTDLHDEDALFKEHLGKDTVYLPGGCVLTAEQFEHMQKFMLRSYVVDCFCIEGSVECQVTL